VFEDMYKNHKFGQKSVGSVWDMQVIEKRNINKGVRYLISLLQMYVSSYRISSGKL